MDQKLEDLKEKLRAHITPEVIAEYGDPFDKNDIRNTQPSKRRVLRPDMSIEDEVMYLAQDVEILMRMVSSLALDKIEKAFTLQSGDGGYL